METILFLYYNIWFIIKQKKICHLIKRKLLFKITGNENFYKDSEFFLHERRSGQTVKELKIQLLINLFF